MINVYKTKFPNQPIKTWIDVKMAKEAPELYDLARYMKPGEKKIFKLRQRKVGIHFVHPREMTETARRKVVGRGLRGKARRLFIEEGMTFKEQLLAAQPEVAAHQIATIQRWRDAHPEEYARKTRERKERATKKREEKGGIDYSKFYNAKHISKSAGITPLEVRKFLRKKKVGKRGGRYAFTKKEALRIAKAARKHYAQLEE